MSTRLFSILAALGCILGVVFLFISFSLNPTPPTDPTQLAAFGKQYHNDILVGAWLQAISPLLIIFFVLAILQLAKATTRFAGLATLLGGGIFMVVDLLEVTFYLGAANAHNLTTALISLSFVNAVQHLYSIIAAPALIIPLGVVIIGSPVLPRVLGYAAIIIGSLFAILGVVFLFTPVVDGVAALAILEAVEELWFPIAAITLLIRELLASRRVAGHERIVASV
ncbi:hypothetical protein [Dictyobacter kobayashii]|uniref:DUF4386 domain-containing protein n=1 Tax=Dictyobacter kobayashii TaxID=2014872 RepID=A0A402AVI9_9CHLR|nr:hypothetical protein [Dictyobacter kobayashii]GCE23107.1 hypothetical protein KDK_69070 [Dictyobacter kobayashii]